MYIPSKQQSEILSFLQDTSVQELITPAAATSTFRIFRRLRSGMISVNKAGIAPDHNTPLRIACVQFCPKIGEVDVNIAKARELCLRIQPRSIDLLCFPEMAFTGYVFDSAKQILPYLEDPKNGPSSSFCQEIAKTLGCYAAVGYPERLSEEELSLLEAKSASNDDGVDAEGSLGDGTALPADGTLDTTRSLGAASDIVRFTVLPRSQVGANSAVIYGPSGEWVGAYRKTNLFETDITWAKPGTGFGTFSLPIATDSANGATVEHVLDISLGICMDLNPHPAATWTIAGGPYELADHCAKNKSRVLVLLNAWLFSAKDEEGEPQGYDEEEQEKIISGVNDVDDEDNGARIEEVGDEDPDWYTLRYWTARLRPLWRRDGRRRGSNETIASGSGTDDSEEIEGEVADEAVDEEELEEEEKPPHETIVVVCNRTGKENGKIFAGSSAIFSMRAGSGRPKLLDMMGRREEGVRVWNLQV